MKARFSYKIEVWSRSGGLEKVVLVQGFNLSDAVTNAQFLFPNAWVKVPRD